MCSSRSDPHRRTAVALLLLAATLVIPVSTGPGRGVTAAWAADRSPTAKARAEARSLVRKGNALFRIGRFDQALTEYERAYGLYPQPNTIFNMAQCQRQLKNHERALFLYSSYLNTAERIPNRAEVEQIIAELKRLKAAQDDERRAREKAAVAAPSPGAPGPAGPTSGAPGPAAGAPAAAAALLPRPPEASAARPIEPPAAEPRPWYRRWYVWTAVSAVVVAGVVAAVAATAPSGRVDLQAGNPSFAR